MLKVGDRVVLSDLPHEYGYEDIFEKRYLEGQFEELKCK